MRIFWIALLAALVLVPCARAAEIILYSSPNYQGKQLRVFGDLPDLRAYDMNDEVSSFIVMSGEWILYSKKNFGGKAVRVRRASYPNMERAGFDNNDLTSLRLVEATPPPPPPPAELPDLTAKVTARAGYDAVIEGQGDARLVKSVAFRGLTVLLTVANQGQGPAGASTAEIALGSKMGLSPSYVGKGRHNCGKREVPSAGRDGGPTTCIKLNAGDIIATKSGDGLSCAIPALKPGEGARCVGVFSVLYNWLTPPVGDWYVTVTIDAGKRVKESNEKNNGPGDEIRVQGDDLPPAD